MFVKYFYLTPENLSYLQKKNIDVKPEKVLTARAFQCNHAQPEYVH